MSWKYTIHGRPVSKKNNHKIRYRKVRRYIGNSGGYLAWADTAVEQCLYQKGTTPTIPRDTSLHADVTIYLAKGQAMDIDNGLGGPFDILQAVHVIENDAQIKSVNCRLDRDRQWPRVEVILTPKKKGR